MKKICFLIGNLNNSGGTERVTTLIANELSRQNYDISILSIITGNKPFFELDTNIGVYSLYKEAISFKKKFISTIFKLRQFVQQHQIDTFIVVDSISCVFTIPALYGLKVNHICWEHFNYKNNNGRKVRELARFWAAKYCDYIVTLTERDKKLWKKNLRKINANIISIANPTPFSAQKIISHKNTKIVLAVGRLTYVKGFDMLIESWIQVHKEKPEWKLVIVGDGEERLNLTKIIEKNNLGDCVKLVGSTNEVSKYYIQSEIFCLSSRFEGFPMVLLEAQAFGLPIVAFDCDTGPSEMVEHGLNGFLVKTGDNIQLAISLLKLINLNRAEYEDMSFYASENIEKYSVQIVANKWLSII